MSLEALLLVSALAVAPLVSEDEPIPEGTTFSANATDDLITAGAQSAVEHESDQGSAGDRPAYAYKRITPVVCGELDGLAWSSALCVSDVAGLAVSRVCEDGSPALAPLFRREVDPATGGFVGPWEQVDAGGCVEDPPVSVVLSAADFRRLPLAPSTPRLQPADGRGLVHVDLIVWTDPQAQTLSTTLLGVPVQVRATPSRFVWDFGDGSDPLVTTDPGAPWPDHTVARPYDHAGEYALTLTTTWTGQYRVNGAGPWLPVLGTATTTSAPIPTEVVQADAHLVAGPDT